MNIPRIIFNFNDVCLNGCPFCFIPFDHEGPGSLEMWKQILMRAYEFSPELISFSGCDPFYYPEFYELLQSVPKRSRWAVDTSLVFLDRAGFERIAPRLDLISTSLDDVPGMPVKQRYGREKLERFHQNFDFVLQRCPQLMVHTLYSERNAEHLTQIADHLISRNVRHWSLYQFWPFDFMAEPAKEFLCPDQQFDAAGKRLLEYCGDRIDFEYVPYKGRANGYFFVSSRGKVYTTLPGEVGAYLPLGSIFDDDIYTKWQQYSTPERAGEILALKLRREHR